MLAERDYIFYPDHMPFAVVAPCFADGARDREREDLLAANLAKLIDRAADLVARIEDSPAIFFGMEDTCRDEFEDVVDALKALAPLPF